MTDGLCHILCVTTSKRSLRGSRFSPPRFNPSLTFLGVVSRVPLRQCNSFVSLGSCFNLSIYVCKVIVNLYKDYSTNRNSFKRTCTLYFFGFDPFRLTWCLHKPCLILTQPSTERTRYCLLSYFRTSDGNFLGASLISFVVVDWLTETKGGVTRQKLEYGTVTHQTGPSLYAVKTFVYRLAIQGVGLLCRPVVRVSR